MKSNTRNKSTAPSRLPASSREAILAAALKAFARDGFDGASLPKIAEMAQVGHPLIHYHFGSKDNLWRETMEFALGDLSREASAIRAASRGLSPLDRLRVLLQAFTHFAARCPDHFSMIMAEARSGSSRFVWLREHYASVFLEDLLSILAEAQQAGLIRNIDLDQLSSVLIGSVLIYFTVNPARMRPADVHRLADGYVDFLLDVLLEGARPKAVMPAPKPVVRRSRR